MQWTMQTSQFDWYRRDRDESKDAGKDIICERQ